MLFFWFSFLQFLLKDTFPILIHLVGFVLVVLSQGELRDVEYCVQ